MASASPATTTPPPVATTDSDAAIAPTPHGCFWKIDNPKYAMSGPNVKPMPNAAPISAMPFARFSGVVQSAITAAAVPIVAPAAPAPIREMSIRHNASTDDSFGNETANANSE